MDLNDNGSIEPYENTDLSPDQRADDILARLSVEDKINLVVGIGFTIPGRFETIQELRVPGAVGGTYSFDTLGIRGMLTTDGPAGVRILPLEGVDPYYCTAFPIASLVSSTWDTELAREVGSAMGNEVREYGMDVLLAPALNIHRDPRAGRNFEYYSEDPLLSGKMAAAFVNGVQSEGVGTSIKHYAVNNQETNRMSLDVQVSERALREIYLKGFELAVKEGKPWTVMSSYNEINGTTASQNEELLETVLREEWGFDGLVMTDWFAGLDPVAQMKAGNDLLMPGTPPQREALRKAHAEGKLDEDILNRNARRILKVLLKSPTFNRYEYSNKPLLDEHALLARKVAAEGAVLLKNEGVLPVEASGLKVAAFGIGSYEFIAGGTGSGDVVEAYTVSLVEGLNGAGIAIESQLESSYKAFIESEKAKQPEQEAFNFLPPDPMPEMPIDVTEIEAAADNSDIAFITLGRISGEFQDRPLEGDYLLTATEQDMIKKVSEVFHSQNKKVIMILNIGNVVEVESWKDQVDAILLPWQGGQEAGNAVVDVLTGKINPSGKLPTTFPLKYEDVPSSRNFPGEEYGDPISTVGSFPTQPARVAYEEGIYVGYRYYTSFDKAVSYPFGFGLSYTTFEYGDLQVESDQGVVKISCSVRNTGEIAGKEAVQVYISSPGKSLEMPAMELRSFGKTSLLEPGQEEILEFSIRSSDYASFDTDRSSWILEAGTYEVRIGASSEDIRLTGSFELEEEMVIEQLSHALAPRKTIDELSKK